ncbi:hypothetical protein LEP1GSC060_0226 [Leptospira weilii serovar Ranarum str. ICFT]|uniref:Uncharacterized protein n=1 Tax=Leptospira weilii serovar Ranarum str. ICFT TaxID=1218598 RepID=N1WGN9_9LEPT|nr:hypothetical protein LEP1GSC060_0226 [Leptospira weilii serovar Ranarum str. ICFT]
MSPNKFSGSIRNVGNGKQLLKSLFWSRNSIQGFFPSTSLMKFKDN